MDVRVTFEHRDPPTGVVVADGAEEPFAGWLGLLAVLERRVSDPDPAAVLPSPPARSGC